MSDNDQDTPIPDNKSLAEERCVREFISVKRSTYNKLIIGVVLSLIVISFFGGYILGQNTKSNSSENIIPSETNPQTNPQPTSNSNPSNAKVFVSYKDSPMKGNQNATVTIVEFSDFQCPFCEGFFSQTLPQIEQNYVDSGKVRLVYRDFPLESIHSNAKAASLAAQCANEQGKFWQYHDILFQNQSQWARLNSDNATTTFKQYATQVGLNPNNFNTCVDSSKYLSTVQKNFQDGTNYSVSGTPTFFIGNDKEGYVQIDGAQPYSVFKQTIDSQLR